MQTILDQFKLGKTSEFIIKPCYSLVKEGLKSFYPAIDYQNFKLDITVTEKPLAIVKIAYY